MKRLLEDHFPVLALGVAFAVGLIVFLMGARSSTYPTHLTRDRVGIASPFAATSIQLGSGSPATLLSVMAGSPNGILAGHAGDTVWDTSTPAFWQCQGGTSWLSGGGAITGTLSSGTMPVATGTMTLGNSDVTDNTATHVVQTTAQTEMCQTAACNSVNQWIWFPNATGAAPAAGMFQETFPTSANTFGASVDELVTCTGITASQQLNQSLMAGTANTTGGTINTWAGEFGTSVTVGAGANPLINTALLIHAQGGTTNYAIDSEHGSWLQNDATAGVSIAGSASINGSASLNGGLTVPSGNAVNIGNTVAQWENPNGLAGEIIIGAQANIKGADQIQIQNTGAATFSGFAAVGNTTNNANATPQFTLWQGAGGGTNNGEFALAGTSFPTGLSQGNPFVLAAATWSLGLYSNGAPTEILTSAEHILLGGAGPAVSSCGGSPSVNGTDIAGKITTGSAATTCTLTFASTYTIAPACTVQGEGTATLPTFTVSATAITMSVAAASTKYNYQCYSLSGGT